jgi:hypothetical protein
MVDSHASKTVGCPGGCPKYQCSHHFPPAPNLVRRAVTDKHEHGGPDGYATDGQGGR